MPEKQLEVLIVDDEPGVCWALERLLSRNGLVVGVAQDGREALSLVSAGRFRLLFLDAKLPDVDGLELARRLRQIDPELSIVLVSGYFYSDDPGVQQARASGLVQGFIGKPFQHEEILKMIRLAAPSRLAPVSAAQGSERPSAGIDSKEGIPTRLGPE